MTVTDEPTTLTPRPPSAPPRPRSGTPVPQLVGGGVLVLVGALWLLERVGWVDISATAVLALATMVTGIALMLVSREGSHGGLVVFGTILALITLGTALAPVEGFQGGIGDRTVVINSIDELGPDYDLAMGTLTLDLRGVDDLAALTDVSASVGMGELVVRVPPGTLVDVDARVGAGEVEILGRATDGVGIDERYRSPGIDAADESMALHLEVFTGRVEVTDD